MRILPTIISGIACATISVGAESLFNRIQLIMRSTFHKFGCSQACQRAVSYSIAGVAGGAIGIAVTAIAYKAIAYRKEIKEIKAQGYYKQALNKYNFGNHHDALENLQKALLIVKPLYGDNSPQVATCYFWMGMNQYHLNQYNNALNNFEKALPIFQNKCGENSIQVADCCHSMGRAQYKLKSYQDALENFEKALPIFQDKCGENSTQAIGCRVWLNEAENILQTPNTCTEEPPYEYIML